MWKLGPPNRAVMSKNETPEALLEVRGRVTSAGARSWAPRNCGSIRSRSTPGTPLGEVGEFRSVITGSGLFDRHAVPVPVPIAVLAAVVCACACAYAYATTASSPREV